MSCEVIDCRMVTVEVMAYDYPETGRYSVVEQEARLCFVRDDVDFYRVDFGGDSERFLSLDEARDFFFTL
jgi:hypothetical protein